MNAFLVLMTLVMGPMGPTPVIIQLPMPNMEACLKYMSDPAEIKGDFGTLTVLGSKAGCMDRDATTKLKPEVGT